jgi:hypothetical protein
MMYCYIDDYGEDSNMIRKDDETTSGVRLYHVVHPKYQGGPLLCWNKLVEYGIMTAADWKWSHAEQGYDGNVVCLDVDLDMAKAHKRQYGGGPILAIDLPAHEDWGTFGDGHGGKISPRLAVNRERYPVIVDGIPAEWISIVCEETP